MTIAELQDNVDRNGFVVLYLGPSSGRTKKTHACSLAPARGNPHWRQDEIVLRGLGDSYEAAIDDALSQLAHFLIDRLDI